MKKYYINIRNSKKGKMFDLLELVAVALGILFFLVLLLIGPWYLGIACAFLVGILSWLMFLPLYTHCQTASTLMKKKAKSCSNASAARIRK